MQPASFLKDIGRRLKRYRKTHGYGIHSPRLFYLLKEVILQRGTYYAYAPLAEKHRATARKGRARCLKRKECELLFRLANDLKAEEAWLEGCPTGLESLYLQAARSRIRLHTGLPPRAEEDPAPAAGRGARIYVVNTRNAQVLPEQAILRALDSLGPAAALYVAFASSRRPAGRQLKTWTAHPHVGYAFGLYIGLILMGEQGHFRQHLVRINF